MPQVKYVSFTLGDALFSEHIERLVFRFARDVGRVRVIGAGDTWVQLEVETQYEGEPCVVEVVSRLTGRGAGQVTIVPGQHEPTLPERVLRVAVLVVRGVVDRVTGERLTVS